MSLTNLQVRECLQPRLGLASCVPYTEIKCPEQDVNHRLLIQREMHQAICRPTRSRSVWLHGFKPHEAIAKAGAIQSSFTAPFVA